ncbi:MAG: hypothetical protein R3183_13095 [Oleiphilaceae bacterium]|nr:hypothetical protein [Oleiphilaceae bacterium]
MSIKMANDIRDLKEELRVLRAELHQIKKKVGIAVNPKSNGAAKGK